MGEPAVIRRLLTYIPICLLFVGLGFVYSWKYPMLKKWAIAEIEKTSHEQAHVRMKVAGIHVGFFPPKISVHDILAIPEGNLAKTISKSKIKEIAVTVQVPPLLGGKIVLDEIAIDGLDTDVILKSNKKTPDAAGTEKKTQIPWDKFMHLPFRRVSLTRMRARLQIDDAQILTKMEDFGLALEKTDRAALLEVDAPNLMIKRKDVDSSLTLASLKTRVLAQRDAMQLAYFKFVHNNNYAIATGIARGSLPTLSFTSLNGRSVVDGDLTELATWVGDIFPRLTIPSVRGKIHTQLDVTQTGSSEPRLLAKVELDRTQVEQFFIGKVSGEIGYHGSQIESGRILIKNPAGEVAVENLNLNLGEVKKVSATVKPMGLEVKKLLLALDVGDTPLNIPVTGDVSCTGTYSPVNIDCKGGIQAKDFLVHSSGEKQKPIVAADSLKLKGSMNINAQRIEFLPCEIDIGSSTGQAWGSVSFKDGFKFGFHTDLLDFKDLKSLADLKFEGGIRMDGTTQGDGHTATLEFHGTTKNLWFENYGVGNADATIRYDNGDLSLKNIRGEFNLSNYKGDAVVRLKSPTSIRAAMESDKLTLADLLTIMSRKANVPITAQGAGKISLDVSGPLEFTKLTYRLRSFFPSGFINQEGFKDLHFDVHANSGVVRTDFVSLKKGDASIEARGEGFPDGNIKVNIRGRGIKLEELDTLKQLGLSMQGLLNLDMSLGNYVLRPTTDLRLSLSHTTLNNEALADSRFGMVFTPDELRGQGQFFNRLQTQFIFPMSEKGRFELKMKAQDYDFSPLFALIGGNTTRRDYEAKVTGLVNLAAERGGPLRATGQISVPSFYLRHGNILMRSPEPWEVEFQDGRIRIGSLKVIGDATQLTVLGERDGSGQLGFNVNGRVNLNLVTFMTPFFQDMRGDLSLSTQIAGTFDRIELLGSAFIDQGYIKLPDVPHPLEDIKADILFSQARALVNRLRARLASGNLTATGTVGFKGFKDFPVDLQADVERVTFNVPQGLTTNGSGHFSITGNWFPYLIKGEYNVTSGLYSKNFGTEGELTSGIKRSSYLPEVILQKEFEPVEFDITTHFNHDVYVKNDMLDTEVHGSLQVKGTPKHPILLGQVDASPGGKVFFKDTAFTINAGYAKFSNPNEFNPDLYATATTRVRDYDVNILVQSPMDKFKVELSSQPPLPEPSIISLLALGIEESDVVKDQNDQLSSGAYQVGSAILKNNPVSKTLKQNLNLDVRFIPRVDETNNSTEPSVIAEKQWTPRIKTSASRTLGERSVTRDVKVEYKLNRNFSVLGTYEGKDLSNTTTTTTNDSSSTNGVSTDVLGIGLQFQTEYK